jgi:hypothetical protein
MRWLLAFIVLLFAAQAQAQVTCPAPVGPGRVVGDQNMTLSIRFRITRQGHNDASSIINRIIAEWAERDEPFGLSRLSL